MRILLGNIGETKETILETVQILKKIRLNEVSFKVRRPFLGSALYRKGIKEGYNIKGRWEEYCMDELTQLPFVGTVLSPNEIWQLKKQAEKELAECSIKV
ncbi:MAG: hypothetical protein QMD71_08925 [bacterium]|nr:hypothetical protein [bacterium]